MNQTLNVIYEKYRRNPEIVGILEVQKDPCHLTLTDMFDYIVFVLLDKQDVNIVEHVIIHDIKVAIHITGTTGIEEQLLFSENGKMVGWLYRGVIVYDKEQFLENIKNKLMDFPFNERKRKIGIEFAKLLKRYENGKAFFNSGHYFDAYNHVIHSLHHLARLVVIEKGYHPELTVWEQVRKMDPGIYKLYEELITSEEAIEKRLELVLLASEFFVHSRASSGSLHMLEVLQANSEWSYEELFNHPEIIQYDSALPMILEYLIDKDLIEIVKISRENEVFERYYRIK